jgi:CHAT domain-containing protein
MVGQPFDYPVSLSASRRRMRARWGLWVFAVLMAAAIVLAVKRWWTIQHDPVRIVARAAASSAREIQSRLSGGLRWSPLHRARRGEANPLPLLEAAVAVSQLDNADPRARHAAALAQVLTGGLREALPSLESLAAGKDATALNDVAAVQFAIATRENAPARLMPALVAVDAALDLDPRFDEARFNRALIIESLGLRDLARNEWESYLDVDVGSDWANEARAHARALAPEEKPESVFERDSAHLAADERAAGEFARRYRQFSRTFGETELLGNWASAAIRHDDSAASRFLAIARFLGAELARDRGNSSLLSMVAAIDRADASARAILIDAHRHLAEARAMFRSDRVGEAQQLYLTAADEFARGGGAAGEVRARLYAANMLFEQGRHDDANREEARLLATLPAEYSAYRAETLWMLGAIAQAQGRFGAGLDFYTQSLPLFEQLGEENYAAMIHGQMVYAYDRVGDKRAWSHRMIALHELGRRISTKQREALASVTRAALMADNWPAALSFLKLEVDVARRIPTADALIQSLLYRAETYRRMDRRAEAIADLSEARRRLVNVKDTDVRARLSAIADSVQGALANDPAISIELLSRAIEYLSTRGKRAELPESLRKRAGVYQAAGDLERAAVDYETAVSEIERQRETLPGGESRWGVFHAGEELFRGAIDLALARKDAQTAFDYAERARSRALLDTLDVPWRRVTASDVPRGTAILEYTAFRDGMIIFLIDERGVRAERVPKTRASLAADIASLRGSGAEEESPRFWPAARALYHTLIAPIENDLVGKQKLVIVADPALGGLPFAALMGRDGRYLVEDYTVMMAPSAAFFVTVHDLPAPRKVLVISGAQQIDGLPAAPIEARRVASAHRNATVLDGDAATIDEFMRDAPQFDALHFVGHAIAADRAALLLAGANRYLEQKQIAAMHLQRTSVVVLAGCGTADGEIRATEGTISVARAFLAAGVPSVIATLWPIGDEESAEFFPLVHQQLARGLTPAEALRAAQLEWIRKGNRSPAFWPAVQVFGRK